MQSALRSFLAAMFLLAAPAFAQGHGPVLWRIADADTRIYIFGSVHALKPGTPWLSDDLRRRISSAATIYMEVSAAEQEPQVLLPLIQRYGLLPEGDSLQNHLPHKLYAELGRALARQGVSEDVYDRLRPWTADMFYAVSNYAEAGYNRQSGVEATIIDLATARHIPVEGLETAEFQITLFSSLTEQEVREMIEDDLAEGERSRGVLDRLTKSWSSGDIGDLAAYFEEESGDDPELRRKMFTDRNAAWMVKIRGMMARPGEYLVVVGAAHLVGPDSLIAMLRRAGVTVERMN
jgi:uncharacterized protein YbaP (TraB family)